MSQFVLLWSKRQNALHVEPLDQMLSHNRESYRDDEPVDFVPLVIGTEVECDAASKACQTTLGRREFAGQEARENPNTAQEQPA